MPAPAHAIESIRLRREVMRRFRGRRPPVRRPVPRQAQPNAIRLAYARALFGLVERARAFLEEHFVPALARLAKPRADSSRLDAEDEEAKRLIQRLSRAFTAGLVDADLADLVSQYANRTSDFQKEQLARQIRAAIGIDLPTMDPGVGGQLQAFVRENVALIKTIPSQLFGQIEEVVTAGVNEGLVAGDLASAIAERIDVAKSRTQLIARDQIGKFYGALNEVRQTELGVDGYFWRTVNDNRVRDEHEEREGKRFLWTQPPDGGHPGKPINCRCYAEPDFSGIVDAL